MNFQFSLAARYLIGRKLRTFLTTLAIVMGVMVIFGMGIMLPTMENAFQQSVLSLSSQVDVTIVHKTGEGFSAGVLTKVKGVEGVSALAGSITRSMNLPPNFYGRGSNVSGLTLTGVDPVAEPTIRDYPIKEGRFLKPGDANAAVITSSFADTLGLKLGDTLRIPTTEGVAKLTIVGLRPSRPSLGNEEVLVTLTEAQKLLDMSGLVNVIEANLATKETAAREAIVAQIQAQVGKNYTLNALTSDSTIMGAMQVAGVAFNLLGYMTLFMGGFIIFNTFRTIVAERRHDIGMLHAIGASRGTIVGLILSEGLVQGIGGTVIGLVFGYLLGAGLIALMDPVMEQFMNMRIGSPVIEAPLVILSVVLGVGVTLFAGLLPALAAGRVTPIEVLRPSVGETAQRISRIGTIAGAVMIVIALLGLFAGSFDLIALGGLLFLVGLVLIAPMLVKPFANVFSAMLAIVIARQGTGELAQGNITRQPSRSAITASATMIGLAIIVGAGGMMYSVTGSIVGMFQKSMNSDYLLVPPSIAAWKGDVGASQSLSNKIRSVPGIGTVSTLRYAQSNFPTSSARGTGEVQVSVLGIDPAVFTEVSGMDFQKGDPQQAYAALGNGERTIIINGILAAQAGGLNVGGTVTLSTPSGQQDYRIVAIAGDVMSMKINTAYISQANMRADFNKTEDIFYQINLAQGANAAAVDERLKTIVADYPQFRLVETRQYLAEFTQQYDAIFVGMYVLLGVLSLPSLIAILNTLAIGVIERTREIGMLRAIGAERRQVRRMVIAEALLLSAIGTAFGLIAGLYLGYVFVQGLSASGIYKMQYTFPLVALLAATAAGLIFGVLASLLPARQASHMGIIQALRYEQERSMSLSEMAANRRVVMFGGKGGVGKTTASAATALHFAAGGARTLIISSDLAPSLSDIFETPVGATETRVPGVDNLFALEIDPGEVMRRWKAKFGEQIYQAASVLIDMPYDEIVDYVAMAPGLQEEFMLDYILERIRDDRYDRVVWDTAPAGDTLRLLDLPRRFLNHLRAAPRVYFKAQDLLGLSKTPFLPLIESWTVLSQAIADFFGDPTNVEFLVVTIPEALGVYQTRRVIADLAEHGLAVRRIVVNGMVVNPEGDFMRQRAEMQRPYVELLRKEYGEGALIRLPLLPYEVKGIARLLEVERLLFA